MNIIEFKNIIDNIVERIPPMELETTEIYIPTFKIGTLGGTHCVNVKNVVKGFDWDSGKILVHPEKTLREIDLDEISVLTKKYDELGWKQYEIRNLKRENKKLKDELKILRGDM